MISRRKCHLQGLWDHVSNSREDGSLQINVPPEESNQQESLTPPIQSLTTTMTLILTKSRGKWRREQVKQLWSKKKTYWYMKVHSSRGPRNNSWNQMKSSHLESSCHILLLWKRKLGKTWPWLLKRKLLLTQVWSIFSNLDDEVSS